MSTKLESATGVHGCVPTLAECSDESDDSLAAGGSADSSGHTSQSVIFPVTRDSSIFTLADPGSAEVRKESLRTAACKLVYF